MFAPLVCTRCAGERTVLFDIYGAKHARRIPCPVCDGAGLLWPAGSEELRKRVMDVKAGTPPSQSDAYRERRPTRLTGFIHERLICKQCGKLVAANWVSRHRKMHEAA